MLMWHPIDEERGDKKFHGSRQSFMVMKLFRNVFPKHRFVENWDIKPH
jgi:hypothetical protein